MERTIQDFVSHQGDWNHSLRKLIIQTPSTDARCSWVFGHACQHNLMTPYTVEYTNLLNLDQNCVYAVHPLTNFSYNDYENTCNDFGRALPFAWYTPWCTFNTTRLLDILYNFNWDCWLNEYMVKHEYTYVQHSYCVAHHMIGTADWNTRLEFLQQPHFNRFWDSIMQKHVHGNTQFIPVDYTATPLVP